MQIYYGAGHEMYKPSELLEHAQLAAKAGFEGIGCSDHLQPWWEPGESGHAWPWLGAVGATTDGVAIGTAVTPAVARYHPVLVAQGFATLEEMFPGRVFLGYGSGESLNESPVGFDWPSGDEQLEMMDEALDMIRRLWSGETISSGSKHFKTKDAKLHTLPSSPPKLYVSAFHEGAAEVAAKHADGLWTLGDPEQAPKLIDTYRKAGGKGEIILQAMFSYGPSDDEALEAARPWKGTQPDEFYVDDWHEPQRMYEHAEQQVSDEEFKEGGIISADPEQHVEGLSELKEIGATIVAAMNCSGKYARDAIRVYGEQVLPKLT
ncbi:MAG TPA: TIGR03557 family F420-dependent LLM class oxidoreductase [Gaiellaceae bacterium]